MGLIDRAQTAPTAEHVSLHGETVLHNNNTVSTSVLQSEQSWINTNDKAGQWTTALSPLRSDPLRPSPCNYAHCCYLSKDPNAPHALSQMKLHLDSH